MRHALCAALLICLTPLWAQQRETVPGLRSTFPELVARLSEPAGYFDTDNLISNERSYLHVVPELRSMAGRPGAVYLGVGPDQNFSYIAHLRPSLAILIDIRRDNLLLHLLFKAIFAETGTRSAYLAMLTGRAPPPPAAISASVDEIAVSIRTSPPLREPDVRTLRARLTRVVDSFGVTLSDADRATIDRFHRRFMVEGLSLQFNSFGRSPQYDYPNLGELLLETDRQGLRRSYLASEEDFQFVKGLHAANRIVPVVGDLSGPSALSAISRVLGESGLQVAAVYTSNVEFYLFGDGRFDRFVSNLRRLPRLPGAVIVRSVFRSGGARAVPGYNSASLTQPINALLEEHAAGRIRGYGDLVR